MGDPQRLLSPHGEGDDLDRELLGSLRDVSPRGGAKAETWDRLAVQVAAVAAVATGTAAANAAIGSGAGFFAQVTKVMSAKVVLGVALAGSAAVGGGVWLSQRAAAEKPVIAAPLEHRAVLEPAPIVHEMPTDSVEPAPTAARPAIPRTSDHAPRGTDEARARDLLALESKMLTEARAQLRSGDARAALSTLDRLRTRFPRGVLMQERDVLTIQVLSALGDAPAAKRKASEFLETYPNSPHAPQLRRMTGDP